MCDTLGVAHREWEGVLRTWTWRTTADPPAGIASASMSQKAIVQGRDAQKHDPFSIIRSTGETIHVRRQAMTGHEPINQRTLRTKALKGIMRIQDKKSPGAARSTSPPSLSCPWFRLDGFQPRFDGLRDIPAHHAEHHPAKCKGGESPVPALRDVHTPVFTDCGDGVG